MYWEASPGDSGPEESDISAWAEKVEPMLPVDDLKGASRAIALDPNSQQASRETGAGGASPSLVLEGGSWVSKI